MAARLDPELAAGRLTAERRLSATPSVAVDASGRELDGDVIAGSRNPELFFPQELFRRLVFVGFHSDQNLREVNREMLDPAITMSFGPHFWERLQSLASPAVEARTKEDALLADPTAGPARRTAVLAASCRAEAAALEQARRLFGREQFDRFLYEAVAPGYFIKYFSKPDVRTIQRSAGGCE